MKTVINHLNAVIEGRMPTALKPEACANALHVIEYASLAIGALRTLANHPGNVEGEAHAKRAIELFDKETARIAARYAPKPAPEPVAAPQDASDLA